MFNKLVLISNSRIKEGKLKKSALTDSVIFRGDDNKYYERINKEVVEVELPCDYPNSWCVVRLKDVCQLIDGVKMNGKGICLDAKYLRGKSSPTYMDKGRFVRENNRTYLKCFADGHCSTANNCSDSMIYQLDLSGIMISWRAFI